MDWWEGGGLKDQKEPSYSLKTTGTKRAKNVLKVYVESGSEMLESLEKLYLTLTSCPYRILQVNKCKIYVNAKTNFLLQASISQRSR